MPRGRAGLGIIPAALVAECLFGGSVLLAVRHQFRRWQLLKARNHFRVSDRTLHRWLTHGLAPGYRGQNPTLEELQAFGRRTAIESGFILSVPRLTFDGSAPVGRPTGNDRNLSKSRARRRSRRA